MAKANDKVGKLLTLCRIGDVAGVKALLEQGAPTDGKENGAEGVTGLWLAAEAGKKELVELLLSHGADCNFMRQKDAVSVLYVACQNGHIDAARLVLEDRRLKSPDIPKNNGTTPLLISAQQGYPAIAEILLAKGADPNIKNSQDVTAFMLACFMGNADMAILLLRNGASPRLKGSGKTGIEWAKARKNLNVMAAVHHYTNIVAPLALAKGGFVHSLFSLWMNSAQKRGIPGEHKRERRPAIQAHDSDHADVAESRVAEKECVIDAANVPDTPESLDLTLGYEYSPKQNRLRSVIKPSTLLADPADDDSASVVSTHVTETTDTANTSQVSTIQRVPTVPSEGSRATAPPPIRDAEPSHRYLSRLLRTYEAEFGASPEHSKRNDPDAAPREHTKLEKPFKRKVDSAMAAFFPKGPKRDRAVEAYCDLRGDHMMPGGRSERTPEKAHSSGPARPNIMVGFGGDLFSSPTDGRLDGSKGDALWRADLTRQATGEIHALQKATAMSVVARLENQILNGGVATALDTGTINRYGASTAQPCRDTAISPAFIKFHRREFS